MNDPMLGRIIGERYRLESCVGTGGMGRVFRARHLLIDREVAIKVLRLDRRGQEHSKAWFLREARAVNRVNHPNIADIYDFGETDDGLVYLVMELLNGAPLTREMERGPLERAVALDIVEQMARALARAHDLGVIHRDLKPDNVFLVNRGGEPTLLKLIDFGLAHLTSEGRLAAEGSVFGTPGYQSPEQARGEDVGPQADLYAVGVMLYEMVTGHPPFESDDPAELIRCHAMGTPPPLSTYVKDLEPVIEAIILKLLARNLDDRYRDAYHVIDDCKAARTEVRSEVELFSPQVAPSQSHPAAANGNLRSNVASWALRASVFGRMAATCYPGGSGPPAVTASIDGLWRRVAELSRIEGELQVTLAWDANLRQRSREFVSQVSRQIEDHSKERSSLHREVVVGRREVRRHRKACDRSWSELSKLRVETREAESKDDQDQLWALLQAAGAAAAREQMHLDAISLVEQKIDKWKRGIDGVERRMRALRRQIDRHLEQVDQDLELGRPRFSTLLEERSSATEELSTRAADLIEHFRSRPECAALMVELGGIALPPGENGGIDGRGE